MKAKAVIPLVLGLCIGLIAVKFGIDAIRSAKASSAVKQTITAVKAAQDIDVGTEITLEMVQIVETVPNEFIPAMERVEKPEDVVGRVADKYIPQNAAVLKSMLAPEGTTPGLVGQIPPGYRAISVKIDEVASVAYQIKPGDWVDVGVVMDIAGGRGREKNTIAEVIQQRVQVAAVGRSIAAPQNKDGAKGTSAKSVTLLVKEKDVPKIQLANTRGSVTLTMRGDEEITSTEMPSADLSELLGGERREQATAGPSTSDVMGMIAQAMAAQQPSTPTQPAAQPAPAQQPAPHQILVYNGRSGAPGLLMEQYTFESRQSRRLLGVTGGPGGASVMMTGASQTTPQMPGSAPESGMSPAQMQAAMQAIQHQADPSSGQATPAAPQHPRQTSPWAHLGSMANSILGGAGENASEEEQEADTEIDREGN